ncbi:MAG: hypothetical protein ACRDOY_13455 [Nocardioidaceae bacterium]
MARRVFLHIGAPKTGTSYLQTLLRANPETLAAQGVLLPGNRGDHFRFRLAVAELLDVVERRPEAYTAWDRVLEETQAWPETVVITNELLCTATEEQAKRTMDALAPAQLHVIYTVRDLARTVPAEWQQSLKAGGTVSMGRFVQRLTARPAGPSDSGLEDPGADSDRAEVFFARHDIPRVLSRWGAGLDAERVHVVTVPPAGSDPDVLWRRFAGVLGVDPASCVEPDHQVNESLGAVEAELLRRVNVVLKRAGDYGRSRREWVRHNLALGILAGRPDPVRFALGPEQHAWAVDTACDMVEAIRGQGYDVVGDLDDLIPDRAPSTARYSDNVDEAEINSAAVDTIAELAVRLHTRRRAGRARAAKLDRLRGRVAELKKQVRGTGREVAQQPRRSRRREFNPK